MSDLITLVNEKDEKVEIVNSLRPERLKGESFANYKIRRWYNENLRMPETKMVHVSREIQMINDVPTPVGVTYINEEKQEKRRQRLINHYTEIEHRALVEKLNKLRDNNE